ncbi:MAG: tetratricopeptide repeat protein, partial [Gammaproteobacteria bacterium]
MTRRPAYFLLVLSLPFLILGGMEWGLRLVDFPLFIEEEMAPDYLVVNPQLINRYFGKDYSNPFRLRASAVYFHKEKPPGGIRIFVQGASTAAGFPFGYGASLSGMLGQRLQRSFPDRAVEVVDTALTAVTSYTLLDLADEIIAQHPDAVVIYAGHNEYIGIMGIASSLGAGATLTGHFSRHLNLAYLQLRRSRVLQLLQDLYRLPQRWRHEADEDSADSLLALAARAPTIPYGSRIYRLGEAQFRDNLSALLQRYQEAGVKVFIGTLVSNLRDRPPFRSVPPGEYADRAAWQNYNRQALTAFQAGDYEKAEALLLQALQLDENSAAVYFKLARLYEAKGDYGRARRFYEQAKDLDSLRFRAPRTFNDIIRELAAKYGASIVEVAQRFEQRSPHGLVGGTLFMEHLHPSVEGFFLLADSYYEALLQSGMLGKPLVTLPDAMALREIPLTRAEAYKGYFQIRAMTAGFPFRDPPLQLPPPVLDSFEKRLGYQLFKEAVSWEDFIETQWNYYKKQGDEEKAAKVLFILADALPFLHPYQYYAGVQMMQQGRLLEARRYLQRALSQEPDNTKYLLRT